VQQWLRYALWFAVAAGVALLLSRRSSGPPVGVPAPQVDLPVIASAGQRLKLGGALATPVVIEAFTSWCSVCERSAPRFTAAAQAARKREVRFVGVSLDESVDIAERVKRTWQLPYEVAFDDGSFSRGFKIKLLPTLIVIDQAGQVRHVSTGGLDRDELEEHLDAMGAGVKD
jgi:cytochrome c biogenesis protein CcmG, thiol:disulfide interchange protein DsbE